MSWTLWWSNRVVCTVEILTNSDLSFYCILIRLLSNRCVCGSRAGQTTTNPPIPTWFVYLIFSKGKWVKKSSFYHQISRRVIIRPHWFCRRSNFDHPIRYFPLFSMAHDWNTCDTWGGSINSNVTTKTTVRATTTCWTWFTICWIWWKRQRGKKKGFLPFREVNSIQKLS